MYRLALYYKVYRFENFPCSQLKKQSYYKKEICLIIRLRSNDDNDDQNSISPSLRFGSKIYIEYDHFWRHWLIYRAIINLIITASKQLVYSCIALEKVPCTSPTLITRSSNLQSFSKPITFQKQVFKSNDRNLGTILCDVDVKYHQ